MDGHLPQVLSFKDKMLEVFRMKLFHEKGRKHLIIFKLVIFYNMTLDTLNLIS